LDWRKRESSKKKMGMQMKTPKAKRGLYYNINKRRKAGLPAKKPGQAGYPTRAAFKAAARTAKKR
jgi:hypothetical protein